jgi:hypothetical protein
MAERRIASRSAPSAQSPSLWALSLYSACIVTGAGIFTVSPEAARSSTLLLLLAILGMGWAARSMYQRDLDAQAAGDPLVEAARGIARLAGVCIYVGGADLAYVALGSGALANLRTLLGLSVGAALSAILAGLAALGAQRLLGSALPMLRSILQLAVVWCLGMGLTNLAPQSSIRRVGDVVTFAVAVMVAGRAKPPRRGDDTGDHQDTGAGLEPNHASNVGQNKAQFALMVLLAGVALILVGKAGKLQNPFLWPGLTLGNVGITLGVVVFSLVGTGFTNLLGYRVMEDPGTRRRVVNRAMLIVIAVEVAWVLATLLTLTSPQLLALDAHRSFSSHGVAEVAAAHAPGLGPVAVGFASVALLLAVTAAANGFTETLASVLGMALRSRGRSRRRAAVSGPEPAPRGLKYVLLTLAAAGAILVVSLDLPISVVLSSAGIAGGGLLLWVVPTMAEQNPTRRSRRAWQAIMISIVVAGWGTAAALLSGGAEDQPVAAVVGMAVSLSIVPVTFVAARRMVR